MSPARWYFRVNCLVLRFVIFFLCLIYLFLVTIIFSLIIICKIINFTSLNNCVRFCCGLYYHSFALKLQLHGVSLQAACPLVLSHHRDSRVCTSALHETYLVKEHNFAQLPVLWRMKFKIKWNANDISKFLDIFTKKKLFRHNTTLRDTVFKQLVYELKSENLV